MRTFIDDLDVYANGLGLKKWAAPLMIIIFPTTWGIIVYRFGNWTFKNINVILIRHLLILIYYIFKRITEILTSIEIDYQAEIGKGLYIGHYSIVIGKHSTIGDYPRIMGNVTIGGAGREGNYGNPKIGNNVYFGMNQEL